MEIIDKKNVLANFNEIPDVTLELGCGDRKRNKTSLGIDIINYECVDIVGDVYDVLKKIPSNSITAVYSYHFVEHVSDLNLLLEEVARVLVDGGVFELIVPHFSNPYFYSDFTHKTFFGLYTFSYFAKDPLFKRKTPTYERKIQFELCSVNLLFKSPPPFYFRYFVRKFLWEKIFNISNYMKEFYEENLCYIFPCYEIKYLLKKNIC